MFLLGDVRVERDGKRLPGFDSLRLLRLLAYLSIGGGDSRARLAYDLWPESTEGQALGNLRKLLHDLRGVLEDADRFLEITQQVLRWRPGAPVLVDVVEFRQATADGNLAVAVSRYGGDLLPGSYDDRIVAERDRLRTEALEAVLQLANDALSSGDYRPAAEYARRALAIDGLAERAYRALMTASSRLGERAEAFRTYHRCVEVLQNELGIEPDELTRAAYEALGAGSPDRPEIAQLPSSRFVGRAEELSGSLDAWREAARGRSQLLLVAGEPGIGKSRLVAELAAVAASEGAAVAWARAYQAAGHPPWGPVIEWLRSPALRTSLSRIEPVWQTEIALLLPELRSVHEGLPSLSPGGEAGRQRLLDALRLALSPAGRPLLLVVDDLQWCDQETIQLIGHLLSSSSGVPLMVAATMRSDEVDTGHPVIALKVALEREHLVTEIELSRLDVASTEALASGIMGRPLDPADAERLWRDTEGQPLFIVEAARSGLPSGGPAHLSRTVRSVISARLSQLSAPARRLVEVAATVGRSFTVEVLTVATGNGEDVLVDALDEVWRRQIFREQEAGYDFSHDRIREVAYQLIPPARRRSLHRSVAGALESLGGGLESVYPLAAAHYEAAGMLTEAVVAFERAGRRSVEVFAFEDAIADFRHALLLLEKLPAGRDRDEAELKIRMALGVPLVAREGYGSDAAQDGYSRATSLCARLGRQVEPPVLRGLGLASLMSCRFDRSAKFGEALLGQVGNDAIALVEGHYLLGVGSFWRGDLEAAREHLRAAIDGFRPGDSESHLERYAQDPRAVCTVRLAVAEFWCGRPEAAHALADGAVEYAAGLDHPTTEGYVRMYTAMLAAERDEPSSLEAEIIAGEAIWAERELGYFLHVGRLMRGWLEAASGGGEDGLAETLEGWRLEAQTLHLTYGLTLLARAHLRSGRWQEGLAAVNEALAWTGAHDQGYLGPELARLNGELVLLGGDREAALELFRRSMAAARARGARWFELKAACSLARHDPEPGSVEILERVLSNFDAACTLPLVLEAREIASGRTF